MARAFYAAPARGGSVRQSAVVTIILRLLLRTEEGEGASCLLLLSPRCALGQLSSAGKWNAQLYRSCRPVSGSVPRSAVRALTSCVAKRAT